MSVSAARFAVTFADAPLCIFAFVVEGRSPTLPPGAVWIGETGGWRREPTPAIVHAELRKAFPPGQPQPVSVRAIADGDIPVDASYRDAWKDDGARIVHDMPKARELLRGRIRRLRDRKFKQLDGEWQKATAQGDAAKAASIDAERQKWRDAPADPRIEAAQTVEDLRVIKVA